MNNLTDSFKAGFLGETYGQWFLFTLLFVAFWGMAVSLNAMVRREAGL